MSVLLVAGFASTSHAEKNKWLRLARQLEPVSLEEYVAHYPLYIEASTLTQFTQFNSEMPGCSADSIQDIEKLPKKCRPASGIGGHAIAFLRGTCLDPEAPVPQLKNCSTDAEVMADPYSGVGVSVNLDFGNAAWVGIPGRKLFYDGNVAKDEDFTRARRDQLLTEVKNLGLYGQFEISSETKGSLMWTPGISNLDFLLKDGLGSDFGINLARSAFWTRVPMDSSQLDAAIAYLNSLNMNIYNGYQAGHTTYHWDIVLFNCAQPINNIFAAAGLVREDKTINLGDRKEYPHFNPLQLTADYLKTLLLGYGTVPTNMVINLTRHAGHPLLHSLSETYRNKTLRRVVGEGHPMNGLGVIVGSDLAHPQEKNKIFLYGNESISAGNPDFIPLPLFNPERLRDKYYQSKKLTNLEANRQYYIEVIQELLAEATDEMRSAPSSRPDFAALKDFYENQYRPYLENQLKLLQQWGVPYGVRL